jgi:hypothetical protein
MVPRYLRVTPFSCLVHGIPETLRETEALKGQLVVRDLEDIIQVSVLAGTVIFGWKRLK